MTSSRATSIMFDRVIGSLDQSLSAVDFFVAEEDDTRDSPKGYKSRSGHLGDKDKESQSGTSKVGYEVFELPVRSPSIEEGMHSDIAQVY